MHDLAAHGGRLSSSRVRCNFVTWTLEFLALRPWKKADLARNLRVWSSHLPINQKKMIILHKGTAEHRTAGTSAPQGEPGVPPTVLTPQSPCTATRAVGVGTL